MAQDTDGPEELGDIQSSGLEVTLGQFRSSDSATPRTTVEPRKLFESVPSRAHKVTFQTPWHRLQNKVNDYSKSADYFQHGQLSFIDLERFSPAPSSEYSRDRQHAFQRLYSDSHSDTLSVIIPVTTGRKAALLECVDSIRAQTFLESHPRKVEVLIIQDGE